MSEKSMQETIGFLMVMVARAHRNRASKAIADLGLYLGQETLLMHLWQQDGLSHSELVERMEIEHPTVTKMIRRLEKVGLVECRKDLEDARVRRVYLTDAGSALQEPVRYRWQNLEQHILSDLTLEEQVLLRRLLLQVRHNLV